MKKLKDFFRQDPRIKRVFFWAKGKYKKADNPQHNWEHVIRDLYRALVIADSLLKVNYSVLIPAVVLHDIALTRKNKDYDQHGEQGAVLAKRSLANFGFTPQEREAIGHCIATHKKDFQAKRSLEAKILYDADMLEKSGAAGIFASYRAQDEMGIPLQEWVKKRIAKKYRPDHLYTQKARKIDQGGFVEKERHYQKVLKSLQKRKDWTVLEKDL